MTHRIVTAALGSVLFAAVVAACSDSGSSTNPGSGGSGAGGSDTQGGAAPQAGSAGKSNPVGGDANQAGEGPNNVGGGGSNSGGPVAEAFWQDFAAALCHRYFHCPDEMDPEAHSRLR